MAKIQTIIFDWGDTVMRDFQEYKGPMAFWPRVEIIEGIDNALKCLQKDFICCLASNAGDSDVGTMGLALSRVNLHQYFQYLFTSHELNAKKPDLTFYKEILRILELKPEECVAVGNDYEKDIVPAKSIGILTIWFSQQPNLTSAHYGDYDIDSMGKLVPLLEKISKENEL